MYRVILHLDDGERVDRGLRSLQHLLDDMPGKVTVALVVNGGAVSVLRRTAAHAPAIRGLLEQGVAVVGCRHSLVRAGVDPAALTEGVLVVPSGLGELVRRQREGAAYVKL